MSGDIEAQYGMIAARGAYTGRRMAVATKGHWRGWVFFWHPDGHWTSERKATANEMANADSEARLSEILDRVAVPIGDP